MEVNGVLITKEFKRVYARVDTKVKSKLSMWSNKLEGHGLTKDSFTGATFVLFDTNEGFIVLVVLQNRFALLLGNNASSIEQQCFFLNTKLRNMFNNIKIGSTGLFKSKTMEDALTKAFEENDFKHTTSSVIMKYYTRIEAISKIIADKQISDEEIFEKAKNGDKSILKLPKARLVIKDKDGYTPVHWLAMKEVKEILKLPKSILMIQNKYGDTSVHYLAMSGVKEILKLPKSILVIQDDDGYTPIHYLAMSGVKEILKLPKELLMIQDKYGWTPVRRLDGLGVKIPDKYKQYI